MFSTRLPIHHNHVQQHSVVNLEMRKIGTLRRSQCLQTKARVETGTSELVRAMIGTTFPAVAVGRSVNRLQSHLLSRRSPGRAGRWQNTKYVNTEYRILHPKMAETYLGDFGALHDVAPLEHTGNLRYEPGKNSKGEMPSSVYEDAHIAAEA